MNNLKKLVKNKYEFLNPLLLCKTFYKDKCDEAIRKSPVLTLGAYSFRSLYKIDKKLSGYKQEALDDFKKLVLKNTKGLKPAYKMIGLLIVAVTYTLYLTNVLNIGTETYIPIIKHIFLYLMTMSLCVDLFGLILFGTL